MACWWGFQNSTYNKGSMIKKITFLLGILSIFVFADENNIKVFTTHNSDIEISILYPKHIVQGQRVRLLGVMKNRYRNAHMGGLTISFPQFENTKSSYSDNTFDKIDSYGPPDKIYSDIVKKNITSKYYMIEGWENNWKGGLEKRFFIEVDVPNYLNYLTINVRGVLVFGKSKKYRTEIQVPNQSNFFDQQGYPVAQLSIPVYSSSTKEQNSMSFSIMPNNFDTWMSERYLTKGKRRIYANGVIDKDATQRFIQFVEQNNIPNGLVVFNSPGGSLYEGIKLGEAIRKLGFDTTIGYESNNNKHKYKGICASACSYAFIGGINRYIYSDDQKIGLHQFYRNSSNIDDMGNTQLTTAIISNHIYEMGVSAKAFVIASATNSNDMKYLTKEEAVSLHVANNGIRPTEAKIILSSKNGIKQIPSLELKQVKNEGTTTLTLTCNNDFIDIKSKLFGNKEKQEEIIRMCVNSYMEINSETLGNIEGRSGFSIKDDGVEVERKLNQQDVKNLLKSDDVGTWMNNLNGTTRWGFDIDISPIKSEIQKFVEGCDKKSNTNSSNDKTESPSNDKLENTIYDKIAEELENNKKRKGLWIKALANSNGNKDKAMSLYIKYRVNELKRDINSTVDDSLANKKE